MPDRQDLTQVATGHQWSDAQRAAVHDEVHRIVAHPTFSTSNRCVALLRFIVKRAKAGEETELKERTLGIEVFGREPDYDVGADPIVRRVASEIRKRLAQYYQEEPNGHSVKIHLLRGGYLPEFEFLSDTNPQPSPDKLSFIEPPNSAAKRSERPSAISNGLYSRRGTLAIAAVLVIIAAALIWRSNVAASPIQRVWKPFLDGDGSILVCVSDQPPLRNTQPQASVEGPEHSVPPSTVFRDLRAGNSVTTLMTRLKKRTELVSSSAIKYQDFQHGPVILIGGVNNPWVQAFLSKHRYTAQYDPVNGQSWVQDALDPSSRKWRIDFKAGGIPPAEDYAVLTRSFNEETGQWIVALSGLTFNSTQAAGELVTNPEIAKKIPLHVRGQGNFQIVLRTTLMGKEPGPIQVVAVHTW